MTQPNLLYGACPSGAAVNQLTSLRYLLILKKAFGMKDSCSPMVYTMVA
jgi:hypothetical protein